MGNGRWGAKLRGQVTTTGHSFHDVKRLNFAASKADRDGDHIEHHKATREAGAYRRRLAAGDIFLVRIRH
jgi:hypothetical protein